MASRAAAARTGGRKGQEVAPEERPRRAIGGRSEPQAEARQTIAGGGVAPGGSLQVAGSLVRAGFGPGDPGPGEGVRDPPVESSARHAVVGYRGRTQQEPVGDDRKPLAGASVHHRGAVARTEAIQRSREEEQPLTGWVALNRASGMTQCQRILVPLQSGSGEQHARAPAVQTVDPPLAGQQLQHFTPALPLAGGPGGQINGRRRPARRVVEPGGQDPSGLPGAAASHGLICPRQGRIESMGDLTGIRDDGGPWGRLPGGHRRKDSEAGKPEPDMDQMRHGKSDRWGGDYLAMALQMPRRRRLSPGRGAAGMSRCRASDSAPDLAKEEGGRIVHSLVLQDGRI